MMVGRRDCCNGWRKSSPRRSFHRTTLFPTLISRDYQYVFGGFFFFCSSQSFFFLCVKPFGMTLEGRGLCELLSEAAVVCTSMSLRHLKLVVELL